MRVLFAGIRQRQRAAVRAAVGGVRRQHRRGVTRPLSTRWLQTPRAELTLLLHAAAGAPPAHDSPQGPMYLKRLRAASVYTVNRMIVPRELLGRSVAPSKLWIVEWWRPLGAPAAAGGALAAPRPPPPPAPARGQPRRAAARGARNRGAPAV